MKTTTFTRSTRPVPAVPDTWKRHNYTPRLASLFPFGAPTGVTYGENAVGGLPVLTAGVDKIANAVASMMTSATVYQNLDPVDTPVLIHRPCMLYGSYEYYQMLVRLLLMRGNCVNLIVERDDNAYPTQILPFHPDTVTSEFQNGKFIYRMGDYHFSADQIIHFRSHVPVGSLWGQGVVERYRKSLSVGLYQQQYALSSHTTGAMPTAVVGINVDIPTSEEIEAVSDGWQALFSEGDRRPVVVGNNMTVTPLGWSPQDAQFIESYQLNMAEQALMLGMRPENLGMSLGGANLTYANRADDNLQLITDSYMPWMTLIEQTFADALPPGMTVEGNPEALMRMTPKERLEIAKMKKDLGILDEIEIKEDEETPEVTE